MFIFIVMKPYEILLIIILSIGAIQGLIYGVILWMNQGSNKTANKFLSVILFFFSYRLFVEILKLFEVGYYDIWYHLLLEYNWIYGALIYFFVKAYVTPNFKFNFKKDWIHFLPVIIEFLWSNFIKSQNFYWDGTRESLSWLGYYGYMIWMHYPTMYFICALLVLFYTFKAKALLKPNNKFEIVPNKTKWIIRVINVLRIYSIFLISIVLIDLLFFDYAFNRWYHYPLFVGMALITYWLGIEGYNRKNDIVVKIKNTLSKKEESQLQHIATQLDHLMQNEKAYTNPNLTLASLSKQLNVKSYLTTKCLNAIFEKKFSDYINGYRIEALKRLLQDQKNEKFTLLSLAFEVGFNSKASFNRAVKKLTGQSPSHLKSTL